MRCVHRNNSFSDSFLVPSISSGLHSITTFTVVCAFTHDICPVVLYSTLCDLVCQLLKMECQWFSFDTKCTRILLLELTAMIPKVY